MKQKFVIAVGNFDGFHLGHKKIIEEVFRVAEKNDMSPALVTFVPNPKVFLKKENQLIFTDTQKKEFLNNIGLNNLFLMDFKKIFRLPGRQFIINNLIEKLNMAHLVIGYNFKFGKDKDCDINALKQLSKELGFGLTIIAPILLGGEKISSTLIREFLRTGHIEKATKLLNHHFYIDGIVTKGSGRGKQFGFPTINTVTENELFPRGVFQTHVQIANETYSSITNIGVNPTFGDKENLTKERIKIETHIFNFSKSVYGEPVRIFFEKKIRDEIKFSSKNELIEQIKNDILQIRVDK